MSLPWVLPMVSATAISYPVTGAGLNPARSTGIATGRDE